MYVLAHTTVFFIFLAPSLNHNKNDIQLIDKKMGIWMKKDKKMERLLLIMIVVLVLTILCLLTN